MQIYENKNILHKKRVQLPQDLSGRFIVLEHQYHQYGRRDVMWTQRSATIVRAGLSTNSSVATGNIDIINRVEFRNDRSRVSTLFFFVHRHWWNF